MSYALGPALGRIDMSIVSVPSFNKPGALTAPTVHAPTPEPAIRVSRGLPMPLVIGGIAASAVFAGWLILRSR
jgi:hypothetical protein